MRLSLETLDELSRKLVDALPREARAAREDLRRRFRGVLEAQLARMELVTREEFEIQRRVLERSREKLEQLERLLEDRPG
ncbi:MAG: accessory factor UbiK family protein [Wenzhouxiangellaceae bacterium]